MRVSTIQNCHVRSHVLVHCDEYLSSQTCCPTSKSTSGVTPLNDPIFISGGKKFILVSSRQQECYPLAPSVIKKSQLEILSLGAHIHVFSGSPVYIHSAICCRETALLRNIACVIKKPLIQKYLNLISLSIISTLLLKNDLKTLSVSSLVP